MLNYFVKFYFLLKKKLNIYFFLFNFLFQNKNINCFFLFLFICISIIKLQFRNFFSNTFFEIKNFFTPIFLKRFFEPLIQYILPFIHIILKDKKKKVNTYVFSYFDFVWILFLVIFFKILYNIPKFFFCTWQFNFDDEFLTFIVGFGLIYIYILFLLFALLYKYNPKNENKFLQQNPKLFFFVCFLFLFFIWSGICFCFFGLVTEILMFRFVLLDFVTFLYPDQTLPIFVNIGNGISVERFWFSDKELLKILKETLKNYPLFFRYELDCELLVQKSHHSLKRMELLLHEFFTIWEEKEETKKALQHQRIENLSKNTGIFICFFIKFTYYFIIRYFY